MKKYSGQSVYPGVVSGKVLVWKRTDKSPDGEYTYIDDDEIEEEIKLLYQAADKVHAELQILYEQAAQEVGEAQAAIFKVYQMLLLDEEYMGPVEAYIQTEKVSAEAAIRELGERYSKRFEGMTDEYMRARGADIQDVTDRLLYALSDSHKRHVDSDEPVILVADELTPGEAMQLDKEQVLAIVTVNGSTISHAALLARTRQIPMLVGVKLEWSEITDGMTATVDAEKGVFAIKVDGKTDCEEMDSKIQDIAINICSDLSGKLLSGEQNLVTKLSHIPRLFANIGHPDELDAVLASGAEGIGLFRSEFLYMQHTDWPSEEEQFLAYKKVLEGMRGKPVIIRTIDIGADKLPKYAAAGAKQMKAANGMNSVKEMNPAMGCRGIRYCLAHPDIFKTQLRALLRAAYFGDLAIMYPMITSVSELKQIDELITEVQEELNKKQIAYRMPRQGVMIETPAAVMTAAELAKKVDFFSIGTNDLTQFTLAMDRENPALGEYMQEHPEAVLEMIKLTAAQAHEAGIQVGICGEMAADHRFIQNWIEYGIDELSMAPEMLGGITKL